MGRIIIAQDYLLNIKTYMQYVSMSIGESEYEIDSYIDVVGALNVDDKEVTIWEIIFWLNWDTGNWGGDEIYLDFE